MSFAEHLDPSANTVAVVMVPVADLRLGRSVRDSLNREHVAVLAEDPEQWPPLLVFRDGVVLDGAHRLHAALRLRLREVACTYFDGSKDDGLVEFLNRNAHRGLGLTLRERRRAAAMVLDRHHDWSDRRVAELCGLAPRTVASVRSSQPCPTDQNARSDKRVGRDGRSRPVSTINTERRVLKAIAENPHASLRQIGAIAGVSPDTVRRGKLKAAAAAEHATPNPETASRPLLFPAARAVDSKPWQEDRALTSIEDAGSFLEWFDRTRIGEDWRRYIDAVPRSRVYDLADEAHRRADDWKRFAQALEARSRPTAD